MIRLDSMEDESVEPSSATRISYSKAEDKMMLESDEDDDDEDKEDDDDEDKEDENDADNKDA